MGERDSQPVTHLRRHHLRAGEGTPRIPEIDARIEIRARTLIPDTQTRLKLGRFDGDADRRYPVLFRVLDELGKRSFRRFGITTHLEVEVTFDVDESLYVRMIPEQLADELSNRDQQSCLAGVPLNSEQRADAVEQSLDPLRAHTDRLGSLPQLFALELTLSDQVGVNPDR